MDLPFDGAISRFFETEAPNALRDAIRNNDKDDILSETYPHKERLERKEYEKQLDDLQIELVKFQAWVKSSGARVAIVFEGRDYQPLPHQPQPAWRACRGFAQTQ